MAPKLDLTKEFKAYYTAKTSPEIVKFGEVPFLTIKGKGEPGGKEFTSTVEALYSIAYGVKNISKKQSKDFSVPKLEGVWWVESNRPALEVPRKEWRWKLLLRMPNFVTSEICEKAKKSSKKKGLELTKEIKFEKMREGKCVQILHIGPYSTEPESLTKMRELVEEKNLIKNGFHHEIYLSDPRRVPEEKMKTILRQPVKEA
jgi:hypothetical protein